MHTSIRNRKVVVANQPPSVLKHYVNKNNKTQTEELSIMTVHEINRMLAHEFIETRLDAPASEENVEKFANFIAELEAQK